MRTLFVVLMLPMLAFAQVPGIPTGLGVVTNGQNFSTGNRYCTPSETWSGPAMDGPALLPVQCMYTAMSGTPTPGITRGPDSTTAQVQADINAASCGDRILVAAGSSLSTINFPHKGCDLAHWIGLFSTGYTDPLFPTEGSMMTPCWSGVTSLPGRPAYPCSNPKVLTFKIVAPNASNGVTSSSGDHYRVIGAEVTRLAQPGLTYYNLVDLTSSGTQTNWIIFDRSWFHGIEQSWPVVTNDMSLVRGIWLGQSNHIAVIDSYFSDFYGTSGFAGNTDTQCIGGGVGGIQLSGWGVYKFVNNHCEASGEGILLGGDAGPQLTPAGCTVNCNLDVPTDIEVRQNYFFKPAQWNCGVSPCGKGWPVVKNGFEIKIGARALIEGNVIENVWAMAQIGWCWTLAPKNQSDDATGTKPTAPTALTNDITYRYNYCYNAQSGPGFYASQDANCPTCASQGMNRVSVHDNVMPDAIIPAGCCIGDALAMTSVADSTGTSRNRLQNVSIVHNTFPKTDRFLFGIGAGSSGLIYNLTLRDNLIAFGQYGVGSNPSLAGCSTTNSFVQILNSCVTAWTVDHNAVFGGSGTNWPVGNTFFSNAAAVGFANYGTGDSKFNPANYQLLPSSSLHNAASDGKDLGADIPAVLAAIAGVRQ